jgi:hypothetical protein
VSVTLKTQNTNTAKIIYFLMTPPFPFYRQKISRSFAVAP